MQEHKTYGRGDSFLAFMVKKLELRSLPLGGILEAPLTLQLYDVVIDVENSVHSFQVLEPDELGHILVGGRFRVVLVRVMVRERVVGTFNPLAEGVILDVGCDSLGSFGVFDMLHTHIHADV